MIDPDLDFDDPARHWRKRAIKGIFHSGKLVKDKRSADRTSL